MTSENWTRAIFVRDPKERFLSAYLDQAVNTDFANLICCRTNVTISEKCSDLIKTLEGFVNVTRTCHSDHWSAQSVRIDRKFWKYINFVGYFDRLASDTKTLLKSLGKKGEAWELHGKSGCGDRNTDEIFRGALTSHATNASSRIDNFYTYHISKEILQRYKSDYAMFNFTSHQRLSRRLLLQ